MATKRPACIGFGPFLVVQLSNGVSLDFHERDGKISSQHDAFLIGEDDFDQVFDRLRERGLQYWADPGRHRVSEINRSDGGRGMHTKQNEAWEHFLKLKSAGEDSWKDSKQQLDKAWSDMKAAADRITDHIYKK